VRVVFHADDFGLTTAVNGGIVEAHERGVLRSTSLMTTAPAWEDAVAHARATPALDVGVHLTLVEERPVLPPARIPSLVRDGHFWASHGAVGARWLQGRWRSAEARAELTAQLERFDATGLVASHLDGHQHLHLLPGVFAWVAAAARRRGIRFVRTTLADPLPGGGARAAVQVALRGVGLLAALAADPGDRRSLMPFLTVGFLHAGGTLTRAELVSILDRLRARRPDAVVEVMLHPGRSDDETRRRYGHWGYRWERDLALLLDPALPDELARRDIAVTSFRDLAAAA
jgi:predicted glycoside hydrolase/deacetylase ChbG (UPF0249 family)